MATTADNTLFVDTNVLIYATDPRSQHHAAATQAIEQAGANGIFLVVSPQILREYVAVASRPTVAGGTLVLDDVLDNVQTFRAAFRVVAEGPDTLEQLVALLRQIPTAARRVHDANIVATMLAHGLRRLLTHNTADFARFTHLIDIVPLAPPASHEPAAPNVAP